MSVEELKIVRLMSLDNNLFFDFITVDAYENAFEFYQKNAFEFLSGNDLLESTKLIYYDRIGFYNNVLIDN
jgi:hypothetical protein